MSQKSLNLFLIGFILYGASLSFHFYQKSNFFDEKNKLNSELMSSFRRDSVILTQSNFILDINSQNKLESSSFNIEVYEKDSLIFWNKTRSLDVSETSLRKSFVQNDKKFVLAYARNKADSNTLNTKGFLLYFLYLTGLGLILVSLLVLVAEKQNSSWLSRKYTPLFLAFTILIFLGYFGGMEIFKNTSISSECQNIFYLNLWQYGLHFIAIGFIFYYLVILKGKLVYGTLKPGLRYAIGSFVLSGMIYYIVGHTEYFTREGLLHININEPMKFGFENLIFYTLNVLHVFLFIVLAKHFFISEIDFKGWEKALYFSLGSLLSTLIFIGLGFQTNTIGIILFLMIVFLLLDLYFEHFDISIAFLLTSVLVFSLFLASIYHQITQNKDDLIIKNKIDQLYKKLNMDEVNYLSAINDSIINSGLFPSLSTQSIQNLDVKDLKSFINNQFKTSKNIGLEAIYLYDKKGNSLARNQIANRPKIQSLLSHSDMLKDYLYYSPLEKKAILHYTVDNEEESNNPLFFSLIFNLKHKDNIILPYKTKIGIYKKNLLIKTIGNNEGLNYPELYSELEKMAYDRKILIPKGEYLYAYISNKSFFSLFLPLLTLIISLCGIFILILIVLNSVFNFIDERHHLTFNTQKSLRSRFQTTIIGLVLFSFLLIGVTTAYYYQKLYKIKNNQSFSALVNLLIKDIQNDLPEIDDVEIGSRLEKSFRRLESIHPLPIAFYLSNGDRLLITENFNTAPERLLKSFTEKEYQSNKESRVISTPYDENKVVIPIYNNTNKAVGFFMTEDSRKEGNYNGLYDFLSTLLTISVFLFLTALALSVIVTTPMTNSLRNLSSRLKSFKLGKSNEPLEWKKADEIGSLISNFNKMQVELNQSAELLSKTQREMAWREMAKQVAHEIKNPLTPMKLSIQHMQYSAINADMDKMKNLINKTTGTILEQIENLTQIADEFSSFGTLPKASNDTIILNEVVEHIHDLFRKREDMDINMDEPMHDIYVFADKNQLVRILNNIVKNATQSIPEDRRGKINIELGQNDQNAYIKVSDNGVGIPVHMKEKVFTPNFTTKSSGTGLGLAISANMIDSMNGKIYFESPNYMGGTDFIIELPLLRSNSESTNEISLD